MGRMIMRATVYFRGGGGGEEKEIGENDCVVGFRKYINSERF